MIGFETTWPSRMIAKLPESGAAWSELETPPIARACPSWAMVRVMSWKAERPSFRLLPSQASPLARSPYEGGEPRGVTSEMAR